MAPSIPTFVPSMNQEPGDSYRPAVQAEPGLSPSLFFLLCCCSLNEIKPILRFAVYQVNN